MTRTSMIAAATLLSIATQTIACAQTNTQEKRIPVTFTGGHDTDRRDGGRPIVLIAAALDVPTETFRRAFSGVTPARGRAPEPGQVHRNKDALLAVLAPLGVTNDRLDAVSDYYRYRPQSRELWRNAPAEAYAIVSKGKIVSIKITNPGSGYSSTPTASVPCFDAIPIIAKVTYSTRFETNGSISSLSLAAKR